MSNHAGSFSPEVSWDAFKAYTRGKNISAIKAVKANQQAFTLHLQTNVQNHSDKYASDPSVLNFDLLQASKRALHLHLEEVNRLTVHNAKQQFFEQGGKNGKLLAMMLQHDAPITEISEITSPTGEAISSPTGVLREFHNYYQCLYDSTLPSNFNPQSLASLLNPVALGWLLDEQRLHLMHPITPDKILSVIQSLPVSKSPCSDGLPTEF